ncbi:MAG TPA: protease modulator HflC [Thermoanaerobaculia bacterium]|nr:MAG: Modulator of FtsH protease HflC [Acidobacteria bacterium ADurb.Bin051]HRR15042.1 protease modulator HflC [Thermoanaerobaculia bacterium]HRS37399.1 protease modulator HflC [Thermoanaerobaculia bacterium]HRU09982.1 protease modulator HflC [Thermoanaerobaculia bacterium]
MNPRLLAVLAIAGLVVLGNLFYTVDEAEQVILTQFGRPVGAPVTTPGLHVKVPFIQKVHRFEKRFLEWDGEANQLPTRDKRFIWVDTYARWRITDPLKFFQRLQDERGAQTRLDDILDGETRNAIANHDLVEVVRTSNRVPEMDESQTEEERTLLDPITAGREAIRREILARAQERTADLGMEILDVRIKRINYVAEVQAKVFDRMISERERIAARFRSQGEGEALRIQGEKERDLQRIGSEAYRAAEEIRGRADAAATEIYARAYNRSRESQSFYAFLKSMETLEATVDPETLLVLSSGGEFYGYLKRSGGS